MAVSGARLNIAADPATPDPLRERPPDDRFCDLILNGGVASGVVYPWALLELARHYRFRNIGGNSVGAMAAALAAAAEYGRCTANADAFEVLRRVPLELAKEDDDGRTRMLRLFQPAAGLRRLFASFLAGVRYSNVQDARAWQRWLLTLRDILGIYWLWWPLIAGQLTVLLWSAAPSNRHWFWAGLLGASAAVAVFERIEAAAKNSRHPRRSGLLVALAALLLVGQVFACLELRNIVPLLAALAWSVLIAALWLGYLLLRELKAFRDNGWGLCSGRAPLRPDGGPPTEEALVEWLHKGIQRSAGRERHDPPLTFADLWSAPRAGEPPAAEGRRTESISLHMFSTNVTLARPVAWPLRDRNARLFFRRSEWQRFFPPTLLDALWHASPPYAPSTDGDPPAKDAPQDLRELPAGGMPIAIAARLSLSFPLLFSCIPVYAIDYEGKLGNRALRQCQLTDGGLCTNFPIHLFDAAHPRWPTFGLMLSRRMVDYNDKPVWLPEYHLDGRADNWSRNVPGAELKPEDVPGPAKGLFGLLLGMLTSALDWNDNLNSRLPHARNRVLRMALKPGEGQLNIAMLRATILHMAHDYGTKGGKELVERFKSDGPAPTVVWQEHLYVRALNQLRALNQHLRGYARAVTAGGLNRPLADILQSAVGQRPLRQKERRAHDPLGAELSAQQAAVLQQAVAAIAALERSLEQTAGQWGPYEPLPNTKLQMRSPI